MHMEPSHLPLNRESDFMNFSSFFSFILFVSSVSVNSYANSDLQVFDGYSLTAYQKPQERMSCRHMNSRFEAQISPSPAA